MKLKEKVAIVVGSTSGIGEAIANEYAAEGATVIVTGRRKDRGEAVVKAIKESGGKAEFMTLDVMDTDNCRAVVDQTVEKYGQLDILVYNAGIGGGGFTVETGTEEVWDKVFATNLRSTFFTTQHAIPHLEKTGGSVLYTASIGGISARSTMSNVAYGTTKAAILHMTKILALTESKKGIRLNALGPGLTQTEILENLSETAAENLKKTIPMGRMGTSEEMAKAAVYLASEDASYITGQMISVCGGLSIG